jgi:hypothetical protein
MVCLREEPNNSLEQNGVTDILSRENTPADDGEKCKITRGMVTQPWEKMRAVLG